MATLGISTNTRLLGKAVIHQGSLAEYAIHLHKESWSPSKANKIIANLEPCVRRYSITAIILSIPYAYHQTKAWKYLRSRIQKYCTTNGITLHMEPQETLYAFCSPGQKKTKKALLHSLVMRFPELKHYYNKEIRDKKRYYIKLFEAIAIAAIREQAI